MNTPKAHKLLRTFDDPVLHQVCDPIAPGEDVAFLDTMDRVCRKANGAGLAAPQIGVAKRAIFTLCRNSKGTIAGRVMLNPVITRRSAETNNDVEGCLSYPGFRTRVTRYDWVAVMWQDTKRRNYESTFSGYEARVIQHEIDHLDGICKVGDAAAEAVPPPLPAQKRDSRIAVASLVAMASVASMYAPSR